MSQFIHQLLFLCSLLDLFSEVVSVFSSTVLALLVSALPLVWLVVAVSGASSLMHIHRAAPPRLTRGQRRHAFFCARRRQHHRFRYRPVGPSLRTEGGASGPTIKSVLPPPPPPALGRSPRKVERPQGPKFNYGANVKRLPPRPRRYEPTDTSFVPLPPKRHTCKAPRRLDPTATTFRMPISTRTVVGDVKVAPRTRPTQRGLPGPATYLAWAPRPLKFRGMQVYRAETGAFFVHVNVHRLLPSGATLDCGYQNVPIPAPPRQFSGFTGADGRVFSTAHRPRARNFDRATAMGKTDPGPWMSVSDGVMTCPRFRFFGGSCTFDAFVGPIYDAEVAAQHRLHSYLFCVWLLLTPVLTLVLCWCAYSAHCEAQRVYYSTSDIGSFLPQARIGMSSPSGRGTSVRAWLVSDSSVLVATYGPEGGNPEFRNYVGGIGGKCEPGESLTDTLVREVREEVGIDISACNVEISSVESHPDFTVVWAIVYCGDEKPVAVPESEKSKVVDPHWVPFSEISSLELPGVMHPDTLTAFQAAKRLFFQGALFSATRGSVPSATWLRRDDPDQLPGPEWNLVMINNKDGLCVPYAIQAVSGQQFDFNALASTLPDAGYDYRALVQDKDEWAMWSADEKAWVVGNPNVAKYFLYHKRNGHTAHVDGLIRSTDPSQQYDRVFYPQGRNSEFYPVLEEFNAYAMSAIKGLTDPGDRQRIYGEEVNKLMAMPDQDRHNWLERWYKVALPSDAAEQVKPPASVSTGSDPATTQPAAVPTVAPSGQLQLGQPLLTAPGYSGKAANTESSVPIRLTGSLDTVAITADRRAQVIDINDPELILRPVELTHAVKFASPTDGLNNMGRLLMPDTIPFGSDFSYSDVSGAGTITFAFEDGSTRFRGVEHWAATSGSSNKHSQILEPNTIPMDHSDRFHTTVKEFGDLYMGSLSTPMARQRFAQWVTTTDDAPAASMAEHWERLWSGLFAAASGATVRQGQIRNIQGHGGGIVDQHFNVLFPNSTGWADITNTLPPASNPVPGWPHFSVDYGYSAMTVIPLGSFGMAKRPRVYNQANLKRDYRVVLYHLGSAYLDMDSHADLLAPGLARTRANLSQGSSFLARFDAELPPLVFLTETLDVSRNNESRPGAQDGAAYDARALENPDSWRDAITFLLQFTGGSATCMLGLERTVRRSFYFFPSEASHLPTAWPEKYIYGQEFHEALAKRLLYLRVVRPNYSDQDDQAVKDSPPTATTTRLLNSATYAGSDVTRATLAAGPNAAGWATFQHITGLVAQPANLPAATWSNILLADESLFIHAGWSQYFAGVSLDGEGQPELREFLAQMPETDQHSLLEWLTTTFAGLPAAVPFPANWGDSRVEVRNRANTRGYTQDEVAETIPKGGLLRQDRLLPLTNLTEQYSVIVPSGVGAVRATKININRYHSDTVALELARRLSDTAALPASSLFHRALLMAVQQRAGIDAVASEIKLTSSNLHLRQGQAMTGVTAIDTVLHDTNEYVQFGDMTSYLETYIQGVGQSMLNAGYPSTFKNEVGVTIRVNWPSLNVWQYEREYQPMRAHTLQAPDASLLVWRSFHYLTVNFFRPDVSVPGSLVAKRLEIFSYFTPGSTTPWDDWYIDTSRVRPLDAYGALRILASLNGIVFTAVPTIKFVNTRGNRRPIDYPILSTLARRVPRYGIFGKLSPAYKVEPLWYYDSSLAPRLQVQEDVAGLTSFMAEAPNFEYLTNGIIDDSPPMFAYPIGQVTRFVRRDSVNNNPVAGFDANSYLRNVRAIVPGQDYADVNTQTLASTGMPTTYADHTYTFFGRQQSANTVFQRSYPSAVNSTTRYRSYSGPITGADGNVIPAGYYSAGTPTADYSTRREDALFHYVSYGDITLVGANDSQLKYFYRVINTWLARLKQWHIEPTMYMPPVYLSGRYEAPVYRITDLEGTVSDMRQRFVPSEGLSRAIGGFNAEFSTPQINESTVLNFDPEIVSVPKRHGDPGHFLTAFGATLGPLDVGSSDYNRKVREEDYRKALKRLTDEMAEQGFS